MKSYVFFQHSALRAVHAFDLVEFSSDVEAARHAQWMLADDPANSLIEIQGGDMPTYMMRSQVAAPCPEVCG